MLAEPRRKQHWILNPRVNRRKLYTEVDGNSTFGQKMLQKMGWKKGKGLGKKEDGNIDHIRVTYKNDSKGMGFTGNDGNWLENQSEFDSLLSDLHRQYNNEQSSAQPSNLDLKSKHSKRRLRYHKMVQGKDLSIRSREDLKSVLCVDQKQPTDSFGVENTESITKDESVIYSKENVNSYFVKLRAAKDKLNCGGEQMKRKKRKKKRIVVDQSQMGEEASIEANVEAPSTCESWMTSCEEESYRLDETNPRKRKKKKCKVRETDGVGDRLSQGTTMQSDDVNVPMKNETECNKKFDVVQKCKRRRTDETVIEEVKENLPTAHKEDSPPKKRRHLREPKKKKTRKIVMPSSTDSSFLLTESKSIEEESDLPTKHTIKKVRFSDKVTVHTVAKHDKVRGGALRELMLDWESF